MKHLFKKGISILFTNAQFAVRKICKGDKVEWLPVVKAKGWFNNWTPIVKIYDRYEVMPYEKEGGLTEDECLEHIQGYKEQLERESKEAEVSVEYFTYT